MFINCYKNILKKQFLHLWFYLSMCYCCLILRNLSTWQNVYQKVVQFNFAMTLAKTVHRTMKIFICCYVAEINERTTNMFSHDCLTTPSGEDYTGRINRTISGIPCQRWGTKLPHEHGYDDIKYFADYSKNPLANIHDVNNYCRNPSVLSSADARPWCFTTNEYIEKEYCNIPMCKSKRVVVFILFILQSTLCLIKVARLIFFVMYIWSHNCAFISRVKNYNYYSQFRFKATHYSLVTEVTVTSVNGDS